MSKKALIILADGFEEIEALGTADVLRRLGIDVTIAGIDKKVQSGAHGLTLMPDMCFSDIADDFDAVILPGGLPGATNLLASDKVKKLIKKQFASGKVVAAICAAPIVFAATGILHDKKFTMYPGFDEYLNGIKPTGNLVEIDNNVVTGKGPGATFEFAGKIFEALGGKTEVLEECFAAMFVQK